METDRTTPQRPRVVIVGAGFAGLSAAKALGNAARTTRILVIRGGVLQGSPISAEDVENLAKLPSTEVIKGRTLGVIIAPLHAFVGLMNAPVRDFVGVLDARRRQLEQQEA